MLQRVLSAATTLGTAAVVAGVASDFVLYDGKLVFIVIGIWSCLHCSLKLNYYLLVVDAGQRAVIFDKFRGLQDTPVGEGTHFRIPFVQVFINASINRMG